MKNYLKKSVTFFAGCVLAGGLLLGSVLPTQALEYKIPTDNSIEKIITRLNFEDVFLRGVCIQEIYKDGTMITKLDDNNDNVFDLVKVEKHLDQNTKRTTYTSLFEGKTTAIITSLEKKLNDGTTRTDFFLEEGKPAYFIIEKIDGNGTKITKTYKPDGGLCGSYSEHTRKDGIKVIERVGNFVGIDGKIDYKIIKEKIFEKVNKDGNKERSYDFGVIEPGGILTFDGIIDQSEYESMWNGQKHIDVYTLRSDGKLFYLKTITEISIELKQDSKK